jgi:hypothetical protein
MMMPSFRRHYNMAVKNAIRRTDTAYRHKPARGKVVLRVGDAG